MTGGDTTFECTVKREVARSEESASGRSVGEMNVGTRQRRSELTERAQSRCLGSVDTRYDLEKEENE